MSLPENMKFKVESPEQSEKIQKALFELGYKWPAGGVRCMYTDAPYLTAYINDVGDKYLSFMSSDNLLQFKKDEGTLCTLETRDVIVPVNEQPTIKLNGQAYLVSDIEKALAFIKPISTQSN